ncbi:cobaltochelatase CobT-related protein [Streptomyces reniochalinae]|uniref:Cobalt chelatase n=1 Tax=Streptomyces reniochalinae TaxID=2250578 RepID=A0A367ERM2_9ACTN|nr:cobalt chelatase [Streptomyces reniochalinae]RCG20362.1 cobalt chelatase [Streptomyces reniochalinae]
MTEPAAKEGSEPAAGDTSPPTAEDASRHVSAGTAGPSAEELCAAAVRALSGTPRLTFRGHRLHDGRTPVPAHAPHLRPSPEDGRAALRGVADGLALRLAGSDAALHTGLRPVDPVERLLFETLEQYRAESLVPARFPGMVRNLRRRHTGWARAFHRSGLTATARGLLLHTTLEVCRSRVLAVPVLAETEDLIEATRAALGARLGPHLAALRRHRADQAAYAPHALAVARTVAAMLNEDEPGGTGRKGPRSSKEPRFSLLLEEEGAQDGEGRAGGLGAAPGGTDSGPGYRVFTTAYDQERAAHTLLRPALVGDFRARLDQRIEEARPHTARLARQLRERLARPGPGDWAGGQEEGLVDGRALARLVVSPGERRVFRTRRPEHRPEALVTFLLDCSGSMKQHREQLAALLDVWARALDLAGVRCEVLGFTTAAWHGGRAHRDWLRAGRPACPGRLNERLHLVVKDADVPYRRARPALAALLKQDLYREGVDGEALEWAAGRAARRPEGRRLLFLVSDGGPMDGATAQVNPPHLLDSHLASVAARIEAESAVELRGLTVGGDLSPYLSRTSVLDPAAPMAVSARLLPDACRV